MIHICHRGYQRYVLGLVLRSRFRRKRFAPFFLRHAPIRCRCTAVPDWGVTHCPNICDTFLGEQMFEAIWIRDQTDRASRHSKNKCFIVSSLWQKQQILLPFHFRLARLSFVNITPRRRYQNRSLL